MKKNLLVITRKVHRKV